MAYVLHSVCQDTALIFSDISVTVKQRNIVNNNIFFYTNVTEHILQELNLL